MSDGSWLGSTPPKTAFTFGAISGIALSAVVVLVMIAQGGGTIKLSNGGTGSNTVAAAAPAAPSVPSAPSAPAAPTSVTVALKADDHIRGPENAKLTIVEFSDFQCPFCGRFEPTVARILTEYKDQVRLVYRHFPLESIHPNARPAAEASECASEQGKFWEFHDKLFLGQDSLSADFYSKTARELGLNVAKFDACVKDRKYSARVDEDYQSGLAAGVQGTPHTIVGTTPISGALPYESVKQVVDAALR